MKRKLKQKRKGNKKDERRNNIPTLRAMVVILASLFAVEPCGKPFYSYGTLHYACYILLLRLN